MQTESLSFEQLCELFNYTPKNRPLSSREAAEILHFQPNTLEQKRLAGTGPRYFQPTAVAASITPNATFFSGSPPAHAPAPTSAPTTLQ